jgi:hypothetical protein
MYTTEHDIKAINFLAKEIFNVERYEDLSPTQKSEIDDELIFLYSLGWGANVR